MSGSTGGRFERDFDSTASRLVASTEAAHAESDQGGSIQLRGVVLEIAPGVFNPALSNIGDLLAEEVERRDLAAKTVLDMGTGSGFQALVAAKRAQRVLACDRQPEAVRCAARNVSVNGAAGKVTVIESDLFSAVPRASSFDYILFNLPFVPWEPKTPWQQCNFDFEHRLFDRFLDDAGAFLAPHGEILATWSDIGSRDSFDRAVARNNLTAQVVVERRREGIGHYVVSLRRG